MQFSLCRLMQTTSLSSCNKYTHAHILPCALLWSLNLCVLPSSFFCSSLTLSSETQKPNARRRPTLSRGPHPPPSSPIPTIRPNSSRPDPIRSTRMHPRLAAGLSRPLMGRLRSLLAPSDLPLPLPTLRCRNCNRTHFPSNLRALRRPLVGSRSRLLVPVHALDR